MSIRQGLTGKVPGQKWTSYNLPFLKKICVNFWHFRMCSNAPIMLETMGLWGKMGAIEMKLDIILIVTITWHR